MIPPPLMPTAIPSIRKRMVLEVFRDGVWQYVNRSTASSISSQIKWVTNRCKTADDPTRPRHREPSDRARIRIYDFVDQILRWEGCWTEFDNLNATSPECREFRYRPLVDPTMLAPPVR